MSESSSSVENFQPGIGRSGGFRYVVLMKWNFRFAAIPIDSLGDTYELLSDDAAGTMIDSGSIVCQSLNVSATAEARGAIPVFGAVGIVRRIIFILCEIGFSVIIPCVFFPQSHLISVFHRQTVVHRELRRCW